MNRTNNTGALPSPWGNVFWLTPTPLLLRMRGSMAWAVIIGSCSLSVSDTARLAAAEEILRQGGTLPLAPEQAAQTVWDSLGPPRSCPEYVKRLLSGHGADVVIEAARDRQDLEDLSAATTELAEMLLARMTPMLATLGLQIERLSIERLEDRSRWDHEA